jgi:hypothetical protein
LIAAVSAAEAGAKRILVLEKWFGSEISFTAFSGYNSGKNATELALKKA